MGCCQKYHEVVCLFAVCGPGVSQRFLHLTLEPHSAMHTTLLREKVTLYIQTYTCVQTVYVRTSVYVYVYIYIYPRCSITYTDNTKSENKGACVCTYTHILYMYMRICMCVYIYIYRHTYIHTCIYSMRI